MRFLQSFFETQTIGNIRQGRQYVADFPVGIRDGRTFHSCVDLPSAALVKF